jgi:hypothetical protein
VLCRKVYYQPLFIGLPGSGKTTTSGLVAKRLGIEVLSTDPLFRSFRAIPSTSGMPEAIVMNRFLTRTQREYPQQHSKLLRDSESIDAQGRCALHDGSRFRCQYGESIFRLFEIEMLKFLDASGCFTNKIIDLSASAPLWEENRSLFSPDRGYLAILLDTDHNQICQNLIADYETYVKQCAIGIEKPIRGAYELRFTEALRRAESNSKDRQRIILYEALNMVQEAALERMSKYRNFAKLTICPTLGQMLEELIEEIMAKLEDISSGES